MDHFAPGALRPNTVLNRELEVVSDNKGRWNLPDHRRRSFHTLDQWSRYTIGLRSHSTMVLEKRADLRIGDLEPVRRMTTSPWFSAMVVLHGPHILHECYAADFGPDRLHSIQSITKTMMNLIIGGLLRTGRIALDRRIGDYLPAIGSGYANATVQAVLEMNVDNDYMQDFADPNTGYYAFEDAMGWRLPEAGCAESTIREFLLGIRSADPVNRTGRVQYKDANTDVLGWLAERVSGRLLRAHLADIVDAAGLEHRLVIATDRNGVPVMDGGGCMTARDLARYGSLFARRGIGVDGQQVGCADFIARCLTGGTGWSSPSDSQRYASHIETDGRWLSHGGYCGQYLMIDTKTGLVGVYFSVVEDKDGICDDHFTAIYDMFVGIGDLFA